MAYKHNNSEPGSDSDLEGQGPQTLMTLLAKATKKTPQIEGVPEEETRKTLRRDVDMSNEFEKTESLCKIPLFVLGVAVGYLRRGNC